MQQTNKNHQRTCESYHSPSESAYIKLDRDEPIALGVVHTHWKELKSFPLRQSAPGANTNQAAGSAQTREQAFTGCSSEGADLQRGAERAGYCGTAEAPWGQLEEGKEKV